MRTPFSCIINATDMSCIILTIHLEEEKLHEL